MIKIHKQLWYVLGKDRNNLTYMTYYENNKAFEKRKDTGIGWAKGRAWGDNYTPKEAICDNSPTQGFIITDSVSRWSTQNKLFRVEDPRGFVVEVPTGNISTLLKYTTVVNGVVQEACVWGREGNNHVLLPITSDIYKEAVEDNKAMDERIPYSKLEKGDVFLKNADDSSEYTYLGKVKLTWLCTIRQRQALPHRWNIAYKPIDINTDEIIISEELKDSKWCHLIKSKGYKQDNFEIALSGKAIKTGKKSNNLSTKNISVWIPDRVKKDEFWSYNRNGQYLDHKVVDIEWKDI